MSIGLDFVKVSVPNVLDYHDEIFVFARTFRKHLERLELVLNELRDERLSLKLKKY